MATVDVKVNDTASSPSPNDVAADQFSAGLLAALTPAVESCDVNIRRVLESQDALGGHIERLTAALNAFTTGAMMPPALAPYTGKLSNARRRLKKINVSVVRINQRLEEIRAMVRKKEMANRARTGGPTTAAAGGPPPAKIATINSTGLAQALASAGSTTLPSSLVGAPSVAVVAPPAAAVAASSTAAPTTAAAAAPVTTTATTPTSPNTASSSATASSEATPSSPTTAAAAATETKESKETDTSTSAAASSSPVSGGGSGTVPGVLPTSSSTTSGAPPSLSARSGTSNVNSMMDLLDWD